VWPPVRYRQRENPVIGRTGCRTTEDQLLRVLLGTGGVAERLEVQGHVSRCGRCARTLRSLELAGSAYDQAFATLRGRRVAIAAGRARLAAATEPQIRFGFTFPARLLRLRLAEAAVAFGVMTIAVVGTPTVEPARTIAPSPATALIAAPAAPVPQPEDPLRMRAARLRYDDGEMIFRVTAGSPY
jgi:hypothetical protein